MPVHNETQNLVGSLRTKDPGVYSRILSLLEEGTSYDLPMSDSGPDRAPEPLLTVERECSSSMSLKCTPDYFDTSEDDMNSIKSVPIAKQAPESQELAVSVYDQETLEKGILQQLDEALPEEKVRKMVDLQMKSVQAEMTTIKKEVLNNETFPKSPPSKDISVLQAKAETSSQKRDQSTLPSSGNDAANECSAGGDYGVYEMELLSSDNACGRPEEKLVTEQQKRSNPKIKNGCSPPLFFYIGLMLLLIYILKTINALTLYRPLVEQINNLKAQLNIQGKRYF
ncbi:uncharacterized protein LOC124163545 [Ischnura elegans]|uniref:uncharacterized protein LOC124163545 n=1 Tax=Ischnura elegans TaxID=197161 RepID=UPI001ED88DFC|nr:uncharacterized protein LOC124163545 [Ischnura elegans]